MRESFLFHLENKEELRLLSQAEKGTILDAMINYAETGVEPSFDDRALTMAFVPIKRRMDKDTAAYQEKCEKNRQNALKGGAPEGNQNARKHPKTTERLNKTTETTERLLKQPKQPDTDTDTDTDTDLLNNLHSDDRKGVEEKFAPGAIVVQLSSGDLYPIQPKRIAELQKVFTEVDVRKELAVMAETMHTTPSKRRTVTRIESTILSWLKIARERAIGQDKIASAKAATKPKEKKNAFHNFAQHDYDFDAIERALDMA